MPSSSQPYAGVRTIADVCRQAVDAASRGGGTGFAPPSTESTG
ncbi:hypothetical protein [Paenibacillus flagellatus]|nr:hypothetical protein [Paenibacillus flagellatus]